MHSDRYDTQYIDEPDDDDDDDDLDDDDDDAYDGLSDYDDDDIVRNRGYSRHYSSVGDEGRSSGADSRRQRSASESTGRNLEPSEDNRRDHHNQLERKRRASIKTSYNDLREVIPNLRGSKASRAVILQRAVECIEELVRLNRDHTHCVETLKRQNDLLDSRVQELQRLVQRMDGEEACTSVNVNCAIGGHGTGTNSNLRLIASSTNSSNVSMYRHIPQDSSYPTNVAVDLMVSTGESTQSQFINSPASQTVTQKTSCVTSSSNAQSFPIVTSLATADVLNRDNRSISSTGLNTPINTIRACSPTVSASNGSSVYPTRSASQPSSPSGISSSSSNRNEDDSISLHTQETATIANTSDDIVQGSSSNSRDSDLSPNITNEPSEKPKRRKLN